MKNTHELLYNAWKKDIGYKRVAEDLQLDPDMVKSLYDTWTKESMAEMGLAN